MNNLSFVLTYILFQLNCFSQAPAIEWKENYGGSSGDVGTYIEQTSDGGYIAAGYTNSYDGDVTGNHGSDFWIVKTNSFGNIIWQKAIGGSGYDQAWKIREISDGGYIIVGQATSNNGDLSGNHGGNDFCVIKLNSSGIIEWQKLFGGSGNDYGDDIQETTDGGFIATGSTNSTNGDVIGNLGNSCWVIKITSTGILEWQKTFNGNGVASGKSIELTNDSGYVISGSTTTIGSNYDFWIIKLDTVGTIVWQKNYGGSNNDSASCISKTSDNGFIVSGYTESNNNDVTGLHGGSDYWVLKLDLAGNIEWQKTLGGTNDDFANFGIQTIDNNYVIAGITESYNGDVTGNHGLNDYWIVKLNALGNIVWQKTLGGSDQDYANSINQTSDNGFIISGYSSSTNGDIIGNNGLGDYWVVKLEPDPLSITNFLENNISIFPNPSTDILTLKLPNNTTIDKITITDLTGKIVKDQTQNTNIVNVENLANGLYILEVFSGDQKFETKFIKQ